MALMILIRKRRWVQLDFRCPIKALPSLIQRGAIRSQPIDRLVAGESFSRRESRRWLLTPNELKKAAPAGARSSHLMFRMLVLQALNNLSDEQVNIRCATAVFLALSGFAIEDAFRTPRPLWLFAELGQGRDDSKSCLTASTSILRAKGYMARGGQIIDASIVLVPKRSEQS